MSYLKKLAGQTMVYGLGTIVPRLLNYLLLTPFFTRIFAEDQHDYGTISELYGYAAILLAVLIYGMETTFFRFAEKENKTRNVFSTALISLLFTTSIFLVICLIFKQDIASLIRYAHKPEYIIFFAIIISIDVITAIPFAYLRLQGKAMRFSLLKIINVGVNVLLNLLFFVVCPKWESNEIIQLFYRPEIGVGYVFISNLIASGITLVLLLPELLQTKWNIDARLLKKMLTYTWPLLIVGFAGMINEVGDKTWLKYFLTVPENVADADKYTLQQLGIYAANFKIAVLMTLFVQMFRIAAEPFFFQQAKEKNSKEVYAEIMKYFVIFSLFIFLGVTMYLDVFKFFIDTNYWGGLHIVPIVLLAKLFFGVFFNLSIWFKLNDLTKYGALMAIFGTLITFTFLIFVVPKMGYLGAAWGQFICYFSMMVLSYFWGRIYFPVPYDLKAIATYFIIALGLFFISKLLMPDSQILKIIINTTLLLIFISIALYRERNLLKS